MNRSSILSFVVTCGGAAALIATTAQSQVGPPRGYVVLQSVSPGTSQSGHANLSGTMIASQFVGGGAGLGGLNASNISSGTLSDARLSSNIAFLATAQTFLGAKTFSGPTIFNGTVGIGTSSPQRPLSIVGGMVVDQNNQNSTTNGFGINFGSFSGEGIASNRTGGANLFGLDFYAGGGGIPKMSLTISGNLGIGTTSPGYMLDVTRRMRVRGGPGGSGGMWLTDEGTPTIDRSFMGRGSDAEAFTGIYSNLSGWILMVKDSGNVGVGISNPNAKLDVNGAIAASTDLVVDGGQQNSGTIANSLRFGGSGSGEVIASKRTPGGNQYGLDFYTGGIYRRMYITLDGRIGINTLAPFPNAQFEVYSGSSDVIRSTSNARNYPAIHAINQDGGNAIRAEVTSLSGADSAIVGIAHPTAQQSNAGYFESASVNGSGVMSKTTSTTGASFAGWFESASPNGWGVISRATSLTGSSYGGQFSSSSNGGIGLSAGVDTGVYGIHTFCGNPAGFALYCQGQFVATGTKNFRIDHPFDPENKYLLHYSAEGPEPLNIYRGTAVTNAQGVAWLTLPDYYSAINTEPTYQLTVVEDEDTDTFVQAKVAVKIRDNRFKIRTNAPNVEVSWEVKARRNDLWVQKRGAPVAVDKPQPERGFYQHPDLYGLPPERGLRFGLDSNVGDRSAKVRR